MKRLTLFVAFALMTGIAMGQSNNAVVDQAGGNQTAEVTQIGALNDADVVQFTDNFGPQLSVVKQTGESNIAGVNQLQTGGGNNSPANTAYIEQIGARNMAMQSETAPGYNSGQSVWGLQTGSSNHLTQTVYGGYTESLKAIQDGDANEAIQYAGATHSHGEVYQTYYANYAFQKMIGSNNGYNGAKIRIDQVGNFNYSKQLFTGNGSSHKNNGRIIQTGNLNYARQTANGRDLSAEITHIGDYNFSIQYTIGNRNTADASIIGDENETGETQLGDDNTSDINTTGDCNDAEVYQSGVLNGALINQTGNHNDARISSTGLGHDGVINQLGNSNTAVVTQSNL